MYPKVIFIGSIGVVAETSELQRQAYNQALNESSVSWEWTPEVYRKLLKSNGGQDRLELLSEATNNQLSKDEITKIHARKTEIACKKIIENKVQSRPGISELIAEAKKHDIKVAWVTTTSSDNTDAILTAISNHVVKEDFDHIFHRDDADSGKPSSDIYHIALKHYNIKPTECLAIEDSLNSALSAKGSKIFTVVTPGENHTDQITNVADLVLNTLDETNLKELIERFESSTSNIISE